MVAEYQDGMGEVIRNPCATLATCSEGPFSETKGLCKPYWGLCWLNHAEVNYGAWVIGWGGQILGEPCFELDLQEGLVF